MSTIVTMTLEEVKNTPLTAEEISTIRASAEKATAGKTVDDPDCPVQTKEELAQFRPLKEARPEFYKKLHPEQGDALAEPLEATANRRVPTPDFP